MISGSGAFENCGITPHLVDMLVDVWLLCHIIFYAKRAPWLWQTLLLAACRGPSARRREPGAPPPLRCACVGAQCKGHRGRPTGYADWDGCSGAAYLHLHLRQRPVAAEPPPRGGLLVRRTGSSPQPPFLEQGPSWTLDGPGAAVLHGDASPCVHMSRFRRFFLKCAERIAN
jgi:hypothetical protein